MQYVDILYFIVGSFLLYMVVWSFALPDPGGCCFRNSEYGLLTV